LCRSIRISHDFQKCGVTALGIDCRIPKDSQNADERKAYLSTDAAISLASTLDLTLFVQKLVKKKTG
jgi:hypothetical protein